MKIRKVPSSIGIEFSFSVLFHCCCFFRLSLSMGYLLFSIFIGTKVEFDLLNFLPGWFIHIYLLLGDKDGLLRRTKDRIRGLKAQTCFVTALIFHFSGNDSFAKRVGDRNTRRGDGIKSTESFRHVMPQPRQVDLFSVLFSLLLHFPLFLSLFSSFRVPLVEPKWYTNAREVGFSGIDNGDGLSPRARHFAGAHHSRSQFQN